MFTDPDEQRPSCPCESSGDCPFTPACPIEMGALGMTVWEANGVPMIEVDDQ